MAATSKVSINRFKNVCFIGLNRVEFHPEGGEPLFAESWMDLVDDGARRNMLLGFFSPRDLNGDHMDPSSVIVGEHTDEEEAQQMMQQMRSIALFDFCRVAKSAPNTMHAMLVADVIFHWDAQDNYIQPTSEDTWHADLAEVIRTYPRTTKKHIYTDWDTTGLKVPDDTTVQPLEEMPLNTGMWINQPTMQEKYGTYVLAAGVLLAAGTYLGLDYQKQGVQEVYGQVQSLSRQANLNPNFRTIMDMVDQIEGYSRYRQLFSLIFKDVSLAIADAEFKVSSYTIEVPNPNNPPSSLIVKMEASTEDYATYAQQEPVAKDIMESSLTIDKIRKPPTAPGLTAFTIEGLIPLPQVAKDYLDYRQTEDIINQQKPTQAAVQGDVQKVEPTETAPEAQEWFVSH